MTGTATVYALSQTPEGIVPGANPAQPAFLEGSACYVNAAFFDQTGNPLTPAALSYRIDDLLSGEQILDWTTITPEATVQVLVTGEQNEMVSFSRPAETHQILFSITDPAGNEPFYARALFDLIRIPGVQD